MREDVQMGQELEAKLRDIFVAELGIESAEISPGLQYGAVPEWDSVAHMHLVAALEEAFDISLSDDDISRMTSFSEIGDLLSDRLLA